MASAGGAAQDEREAGDFIGASALGVFRDTTHAQFLLLPASLPPGNNSLRLRLLVI